MSACICRLQADECTGSSGIYYPLQDGGQCAIQDCEKQVTTDNSAALVNALAEIDSLQTLVASHRMVQAKLLVEKYELGQVIKRKDAALRMALDAIEGTYIGWRGEKSGEAITTIKEALARQLINRGILQLTRPSRAEFKVVDVVQVAKESP